MFYQEQLNRLRAMALEGMARPGDLLLLIDQVEELQERLHLVDNSGALALPEPLPDRRLPERQELTGGAEELEWARRRGWLPEAA